MSGIGPDSQLVAQTRHRAPHVVADHGRTRFQRRRNLGVGPTARVHEPDRGALCLGQGKECRDERGLDVR